MGLLDRNKRKPAAAPAAPVAAPAADATQAAAPASPISQTDADSLRDMLIAAASARDDKLVMTLATANRQAIAAHFAQWQKVPDAIRENGGAMQRYAATLIALAEMFRDKFGDPSLMALLSGPGPEPQTMQAQWERGIAQAEKLASELRFEESRDLLQQIVTALENVPPEGPTPYHAVTEGRLAFTLFSMGDVPASIGHMQRALEFSQARNDETLTINGLRGMFEINRYMGKFVEAADYGDRLAAMLAKTSGAEEGAWWRSQAASVRAGEPLCRVMFYVNDKQCEIDEVPKLSVSRLRYGFVRNRPSLTLCEALVHRGMQAGGKGNLEEALKAFREGSRVDPYDPSPRYQAAMTLMHLQRPAEALEEFDQTEKLAPGWFGVRGERWLAHEIVAGRIEAPVFFIVRSEEAPDEAMTWEQKLALVDEAIGHAGELPHLLLYRARCLMRLKRAPEAEPILRSALEKSPEPDVRTKMLVDLQMIVADIDEKRRLLNEAIALNGNLASAAVAKISLRQLE